jgi:hypothetical protein
MKPTQALTETPFVTCVSCGETIPESETWEGWEERLRPDDLHPVPLCEFCANWPHLRRMRKLLESLGLVFVGVQSSSVPYLLANDPETGSTLTFDTRWTTREVVHHVIDSRRKFKGG